MDEQLVLLMQDPLSVVTKAGSAQELQKSTLPTQVEHVLLHLVHYLPILSKRLPAGHTSEQVPDSAINA